MVVLTFTSDSGSFEVELFAAAVLSDNDL